MIVVADTGPVNYLVLSGHVHLVHELYGRLVLPPAVHQELLHARAPTAVRQWATMPPPWVGLRLPKDSSRFMELGPGEREALSLALEINADFLLVDEASGRRAAVANGVAVKGTLGILEDAAHRGLVDFAQALDKLRSTSIFLSDEVVQGALNRHRDLNQERIRPAPP